MKSTSAYVKKSWAFLVLSLSLGTKTSLTFTFSWSTLPDRTKSHGLFQKKDTNYIEYIPLFHYFHISFLFITDKKTGAMINSTLSPQMDEYVKLFSKISFLKKKHIHFNSNSPTKISPIATAMHIHECTLKSVSPLIYASWNYIRKHIWETRKRSECLVNL